MLHKQQHSKVLHIQQISMKAPFLVIISMLSAQDVKGIFAFLLIMLKNVFHSQLMLLLILEQPNTTQLRPLILTLCIALISPKTSCKLNLLPLQAQPQLLATLIGIERHIPSLQIHMFLGVVALCQEYSSHQGLALLGKQ